MQGRSRNESDQAIAGFRVGFTVTKKVGHATERNRIRRRLKAAVQAATLDDAAADVDIVILGRRPALAADFATLVTDLQRGIRAVVRPRTRRPQPSPVAGEGRHGTPLC